MKIAILITSHNRKDTTLTCLFALYKNKEDFDVFLVDDGSTDGTSEAIKQNFPQVNIIKGTGNLFWNQGMRFAWETAVRETDYDYYIWLNDDTLIFNNTINELLQCDIEAKQKGGKQAIIVGSCKTSNKIAEFSYGGRNDNGSLIPNGEIQECKYINGNLVLVPKNVYDVIGNLSNDYTHGIGDTDYGLRCIKNGFKCYVSKEYLAVCPRNGVPDWCNPKVPLRKRINILNSPKGLNIREHIVYRKKFHQNWVIFTIKVYFRTIFPRLYKIIKH